MERDIQGRVGPATHWDGCASDPAHWRCRSLATLARVIDAAEAVGEADRAVYALRSGNDYAHLTDAVRGVRAGLDALAAALRGEET